GTNITVRGAPEAVTGAPSSLQPTQAVVTGQVDPRSNPTSYQFEYGVLGLTNSTPPANAGLGVGFEPVSATLANLEPATTYRYRLKATNSLGTQFGQESAFTMPPDRPV